ncbi:MAG: ArsR family transcriptional regulator [Hyphomicrobium sp.]|nr:MAG: ArsR family transcriptional regulator [Hyphomicrobium sp.]PPD01353.1 MAG: ArsR family transcriptional regulator [Hyphomicrobium sp.]
MDCAQIMKVLGDQTRMSVLEMLLKRPQHVHEINDQLGLDPTLLSHHLRALRDAGLVVTEREGRSILYRLSPEIRRNPQSQSLDFGCCTLKFRTH